MKLCISIVHNNKDVITTLVDQTDKKLLDYIKEFKILFDSTEKIKVIETFDGDKNTILIIRSDSINSIKIEEI